jgi:hypothetical protein
LPIFLRFSKIPTQEEIESAEICDDKIYIFDEHQENIINMEFKNIKNGNNNK